MQNSSSDTRAARRLRSWRSDQRRVLARLLTEDEGSFLRIPCRQMFHRVPQAIPVGSPAVNAASISSGCSVSTSSRITAPASLTGTHSVSRTRKESPTIQESTPTPDAPSVSAPDSPQEAPDLRRETSDESHGKSSADRPRPRIVPFRCRTVRRACRPPEETPRCGSSASTAVSTPGRRGLLRNRNSARQQAHHEQTNARRARQAKLEHPTRTR